MTNLKFTRLTNGIRVNVEITIKNVLVARSYETLGTLNNVPSLSITGDIKKSRSLISCGQCQDSIENAATFVSLWNKFHLNCLNAGTLKQQEILASEDFKKGSNFYTSACSFLELQNMLIDNGYKFGSEWLYMPLPDDILQQLTNSLTDAGFAAV